MTTGLYHSIHAQPEAVRALLTDWDGPSQAAERLADTGRVLLAGIGTSFHAALVGEYLLRLEPGHCAHLSLLITHVPCMQMMG